MIRWGPALGVLALCHLAPAQAQDRPPERPEGIETQPLPAAPPARPEVEDEDEDEDETSAADAPKPQGDPPPEQAEAFGPPVPPRWFTLRESDADYAACKLALSYLGAAYSEEPALSDPQDADCGIARPIRVERILPDLTLEGGAVMRCDTARALGFWARDFLRPASAMLPGAPRVVALQLGTTYDCRPRIGTGAEKPKLSEHALGNAIDIAAFVFDGQEPLAIQPRTESGDLPEAFQRAVRAAGCLFFTTVLGPGSNEAHDDHLHFDVAVRRGGWRLCQ